MKPLAILAVLAAALLLRWILRAMSTPERLPLLEDDDWTSEDTYTAALARRLVA